jgi:hypothetical protein
MAYMDGQMSASEALEFERSLSPEDLKRINEEVRLEAAICDSLAGQEQCPEALWNGLKLRMKNQMPNRRGAPLWQRRLVAAAVAATIVAVSTVAYRQLYPESAMPVALGLEIEEATVQEFAGNTEVPGTREATQKFLDDHGVALMMASLEGSGLVGHHEVKLLGACMGKCPEGSVIEVRLTCCDKPIKLLISKVGSGGAGLIRRGTRCGTVTVTRVTDGFVTALVGDIHGNDKLLNLLKSSGGNVV